MFITWIMVSFGSLKHYSWNCVYLGSSHSDLVPRLLPITDLSSLYFSFFIFSLYLALVKVEVGRVSLRVIKASLVGGNTHIVFTQAPMLQSVRTPRAFFSLILEPLLFLFQSTRHHHTHHQAPHHHHHRDSLLSSSNTQRSFEFSMINTFKPLLINMVMSLSFPRNR